MDLVFSMRLTSLEFPSRAIRIFTRSKGIDFIHRYFGPVLIELMESDILLDINNNEIPSHQVSILF